MFRIKSLLLMSFGVLASPRFCDDVKQYSGHLEANGLFYWFFESRGTPLRDPLILWLSGGPGFSSLNSIFMGNGPCTMNSEPNPNSWNRFANIIYLDQPGGTGYSQGAPSVNTSEEAGKQVVKFLGRFFDQYPEYQDLNVHIVSESYGGHFAPEIAHQIHSQNPQLVNPIRLKSIAIASPFTDPKSQFPALANVACQHPSISESICQEMKKASPKCHRQALRCRDPYSCRLAYQVCLTEVAKPYLSLGNDMYTIDPTQNSTESVAAILEEAGKTFNFPNIQYLLNTTSSFISYNSSIYNSFVDSGDFMTSLLPKVKQLLDNGYRVLLYAGTNDLFCNFRGVMNLATSIVPQLPSSRWDHKIMNVSTKSHNNLQISKFPNASHWISIDYPKASYRLIRNWIRE